MKIGVFISEEGFGHAARQIAICERLIAHDCNVKLIFFSDKRTEFLRSRINHPRAEFRNYSNPYYLIKDSLASLDIENTYNHFLTTLDNRGELIDRILEISSDIDIFISDGVPIVSQASSFFHKKSYSVQHFSWHWLLVKLHTQYHLRDPNYQKIAMNMLEDFQKYTAVIKLPLSFSDDEALSQTNCFSCSDLIISPDLLSSVPCQNRRNLILLMDNGTNSLRHTLESLHDHIAQSNHSFALRTSTLNPAIQNYYSILSNIESISTTREMHSLIPESSALIARGGFNTISESLYSSTPCALINENNNPEISANLELIRSHQLGIVLEAEDLRKNFADVINLLLSDESRRAAIKNHLTFQYDGANIVSNYILKSINA